MVALLSSDSLSDRETGVDMSVNTSTAFFAAIWNESEMVVGWIPTCGVRETYQSLVMSTEHVYTYMCVYYVSYYKHVCVCVCVCVCYGRSPEVIRPPGKCHFFLWGMATVGQREGAQ